MSVLAKIDILAKKISDFRKFTSSNKMPDYEIEIFQLDSIDEGGGGDGYLRYPSGISSFSSEVSTHHETGQQRPPKEEEKKGGAISNEQRNNMATNGG